MKNHRVIVLYLVSVGIIGMTTLGWFAMSRVRAASSDAQSRVEPPTLQRTSMKASLGFPKLKVRGPQPNGTLRSKPLFQNEIAPQ